MISDRQLWGLGGLSTVATFVVLLGASGAGPDISRAAEAALGRHAAPATQSASATTPANANDASAATKPAGDGAVTAPAGVIGTATAAADNAADNATHAADDTTGGSAGTGPTATTPARAASNVKHVFVITLAGQAANGAFDADSPATYLAGQLRPKGLLLSGYSSLGSSGIADRIALVSGQPPNAATRAGCATYSQIPPLTTPDDDGLITKDGCVYPNTVVTVAEQLQGKGLSWKSYAEDLDQGPQGASATCRRPAPDQADETQEPRSADTYAAHNVPWVYFRSLIDVSSCDASVAPLTQLTKDLATAQATPNLAYISPGLCSDGSQAATACASGNAGGLAAADAFLQRVVPPILASAAYQRDGLLIVNFAGGPAAAADVPARTGALLVSKFVSAGGTADTSYGPYSLLRTIEDIFAVPKYLGKAQDAPSLADDVLVAAWPIQAGDD